MSTASERHRARRAQIEAERAEIRRREAELANKRKQKKKSSTIMAKWRQTGGVKMGDTPVRGGLFYAGVNMSEMVEPKIGEPSLLDPTVSIAESSENMSPLPAYPMYNFLSPEQRKGYIEFLASDRTTAKDIGFVFLYLYGLERRLILDIQKPDEVCEEDRNVIIDEIVRLYDTFGAESRSLCHYISLLLLYDGTIFERYPKEKIKEIFCLDDDSNYTKNKGRENTDNSNAMTYMLISRLKSNKIDIPIRDIIAAGKARLLCGNNPSIREIDSSELYEERFDNLVYERISATNLQLSSTQAAKPITQIERPQYFPSSMTIRKLKNVHITSNICKDPETIGVPIKAVSNIIFSCYNEFKECEKIMQTVSLRDIDKVSIDTLDAFITEDTPLKKHLKNKSNATFVPMELLEKEIAVRFGCAIQYTSKGEISAVSQQLIAAAAAVSGWQAVLPETIEGLATASWKIKKDSIIMMFNRGTGHKKKHGKRCLGQIFGKDEDTYSFNIPGNWLVPSCLGYIYAWFINKCSASFDRKALFKYSADFLPEFSEEGIRTNQRSLFFALMYATTAFELSTHGIKQCLASVPFESVQTILFSLVNDTFGRSIPNDVMDALKEIYKKTGHDEAMILYDYQAGNYQLKASGEIGFFIDEEKLASTIEDTSDVHSMLNKAIGHGSDNEIMLGEDKLNNTADTLTTKVNDVVVEDDNSITDNTSINTLSTEDDNNKIPSSNDNDANNNFITAKDKIIEFFDGGDEAQTSDLMTFIVESGFASTTAEAMTFATNINDYLGYELLEIDGADVYLNEE